MFSCKVSFILIRTSLLANPNGVISGFGDIGGEIIICSWGFSSLINSLKSILTSLESKFVEKFSGAALTNFGGMESTFPPVGVPFLAHCTRNNEIKSTKIRERCFFMKIKILNKETINFHFGIRRLP